MFFSHFYAAGVKYEYYTREGGALECLECSQFTRMFPLAGARAQPGAKPIEGVSTSTAGMVGVAVKGPLDTSTTITIFKEFLQLFGGYLDEDYGEDRYLPHAVEGFF